MQRRIVGFHQDQEGAWVADLECGHARHMRHEPPWQVRPWVTDARGSVHHDRDYAGVRPLWGMRSRGRRRTTIASCGLVIIEIMLTAATKSPPPAVTPAQAIAAQSPSALTWPLTAVLLSSAAIVVGILWDISWHKTVGRDTFWTLPHLVEQLGAIVAGVSCGWLVLRTTFAGSIRQRAESVRFWGFRGPLGAWVTIWGTFVMITSAPFDNWWHDAYGLDVKIMSPPHMVLALGMISVVLGGMLMVLAAQNRATDAGEVRKLAYAFAFAGGLLVVMVATMISEYASRPNNMHQPLFYQVAAGAFPVLLVALGRSGRLRFPATASAAVYMGIILATMWILQLFPAEARLAPIYTRVTHMVPPEFPLLLDRARARDRSAAPARRPRARLAAGRRPWTRVRLAAARACSGASGSSCSRPPRGISSSRRTSGPTWSGRGPGSTGSGACPKDAARQSRRCGARARPGLRRAHRDGIGTGRALVGQRDVAGDAMRPPAARALGLAGLVALCSAHVGSPDVWYEGAAGPYHVVVYVRLPGRDPRDRRHQRAGGGRDARAGHGAW